MNASSGPFAPPVTPLDRDGSPASGAVRERLRARRLEFEATADALFDEAWRDMRDLAQPFRFELDALREPGGRWRDLLATSPLPALDLPVLLLEDLGAPPNAARDRVERTLVEATALAFSGVLALELATGAESNFSFEHALLPPGLVAASAFRLAEAAGDARAIRGVTLEHWNACCDALLTHRARRVGRSDGFDARDVARIGRRWSPLSTPLACAARFAGREALWSEIEPLFDEAHALFQIGRELASLSRDLSRGHCTFPIARLLAALGAKIPAEQAPNPGATLFAAVVTPALPEIAAESQQRARALASALESRGLSFTRRALASLSGPFADVAALYATKRVRAPQPPAPFVVSTEPQLAQVIGGAARSLRDDPTYRESWEVNRWEFLNHPQLVCTVFPTGLILENRSRAGDDCEDELESLVARYADNRFHYYDQPSALPPDCDTLGLMLRLGARARDPDRWRRLLATPLSWLERNIAEDGAVPVFMTRDVDVGAWPPYVQATRCACAAVAAGLLLGLVELAPPGWEAIVDRGARATFADVTRSGGGAFWFYDAPLGVELVLALATALRQRAHPLAGQPVLAEAEARCVELIAALRGRARVSCLDAALLHLATGHAPARPLRDPAWIEHLTRAQRQDGTWDACPLYIIPTRANRHNWYSSRLVTTSFAYRALREHERETGVRR